MYKLEYNGLYLNTSIKIGTQSFNYELIGADDYNCSVNGQIVPSNSSNQLIFGGMLSLTPIIYNTTRNTTLIDALFD